MAKQRRPRPRASTRKAQASRAVPSRALRPPAQPAPPPREVTPPKRTAYVEAVALYQRGLEALQRRDFERAREALRGVLEQYPEERELHERVRLYLKVCERESGPPPPPPQTYEERVYAATVALNAGHYEQALALLGALQQEDPENDHVQFMLAVAYALLRQTGPAIGHLRRAIELNPENRVLARQEPDFEAIRADDGFRQALEVPAQASRRRARGRVSH